MQHATPSTRLPRSRRIRKKREFERVYAQRCAVRDQVLNVHVAANEFDHPRLGLSVSRKVGNAVRRNRWKRLIREAFRLNQQQLPAGRDIVVSPGRVEPTLERIQDSLVKLSRRAASKLGEKKRS